MLAAEIKRANDVGGLHTRAFIHCREKWHTQTPPPEKKQTYPALGPAASHFPVFPPPCASGFAYRPRDQSVCLGLNPDSTLTLCATTFVGLSFPI